MKTACIVALVLASQGGIAQTNSPAKDPVIKIDRLNPSMRALLFLMGDRLTVPGNERLTLNGTVTLADGSQTSAQVIFELPDRLRYQQTKPPRIVVYDGTTVTTSTGSPSAADYGLVESFVLDGVERFLASQTEGGFVRVFGHVKVTMPGHGTPDQLCELYHLTDRARFTTNALVKQKAFCFDSHTRLIAAVVYQDPGNAGEVATSWAGWTFVGHSQIPGTVTRQENGKPVFSLNVLSSTVSAAGDRSVFSRP